MSDDTKGKFVTRFVALLFMGMAFTGCAAILSSQDSSLFVDVGRAAMAR